jgi:hypothetical protein
VEPQFISRHLSRNPGFLGPVSLTTLTNNSESWQFRQAVAGLLKSFSPRLAASDNRPLTKCGLGAGLSDLSHLSIAAGTSSGNVDAREFWMPLRTASSAVARTPRLMTGGV